MSGAHVKSLISISWLFPESDFCCQRMPAGHSTDKLSFQINWEGYSFSHLCVCLSTCWCSFTTSSAQMDICYEHTSFQQISLQRLLMREREGRSISELSNSGSLGCHLPQRTIEIPRSTFINHKKGDLAVGCLDL